MKHGKIQIEVVKRKKTLLPNADLKLLAWSCIQAIPDHLESQYLTIDCSTLDEVVSKHIETISMWNHDIAPVEHDNTSFVIYRLFDAGPEVEVIEADSSGDCEVSASNHWMLPCRDFQGLWENLIYEDGVKENILKFVETTMLFSRRKVNPNIITCNRLVLLHGPPGTGKTSLCKAIAQKLAIHMSDTYRFTHLLEINSHSLFSKWFSESGKLVMKIFTKIRDIIELPDSLVCVLIDEVESIAFARDSLSSNEPSDSVRVVNAVLTQLDQIRKYPNVLILTTSNLTSNIDLAFLDRADIKQFIGNPSCRAIYEIYSSALIELQRTNLIVMESSLLSYRQMMSSQEQSDSHTLHNICKMSEGLSGRVLRKIPFLAHALFLQSTEPFSLAQYLEAMRSAVLKHLDDKNKVEPQRPSDDSDKKTISCD